MKEIDDTITMLLKDDGQEQEIPVKTEKELLRVIMIKAHDMGVLVASKEEMELLPNFLTRTWIFCLFLCLFLYHRNIIKYFF